jgi:(p)ppGpp synthase/HD superfamily hydrolase
LSEKIKAGKISGVIVDFPNDQTTETSRDSLTQGRYKSIYSIWHKMQSKNIPFEEVFDLMAIRIVFDPLAGVPEKTQCWNIYSMITDIYMPKPKGSATG